MTKSIQTLSEFRSGSSWISLYRNDFGSLPSVVRVVMNVVPPTLSFTHSFLPFLSVNFVMSKSKLLPVLTSIESVSVFTATSTIPFLLAMGRQKECLHLANTLAGQEERYSSKIKHPGAKHQAHFEVGILAWLLSLDLAETDTRDLFEVRVKVTPTTWQDGSTQSREICGRLGRFQRTSSSQTAGILQSFQSQERTFCQQVSKMLSQPVVILH